MTITAYVPPLTRAQRAALGLVVAAGAAGALVSSRTATEPVRVHWRAVVGLATLGYVRWSDVESPPGRVFATPAGRQRMRIEYAAERRHPSVLNDDLRVGKPQKRGAPGR